MNDRFRILKVITVSFLMFLVTGNFSYAQKSGQSGKLKVKPVAFKNLNQVDIGKLTKAGTAVITNGELVIEGSGADIWGKHDEFHFSYLKLKGDFDLSVRILGLTATHLYTKAGIMAREDLSDDSPHVYYQVFPNNSARNKNNDGCEFQYRTTKTGDMKAIYPADGVDKVECKVDFPNTYIRMKRQGDHFESFFSNDNKNWVHYSTFALKMANELYVGLAVTSHQSTDYTTAKFSSCMLGKK